MPDCVLLYYVLLLYVYIIERYYCNVQLDYAIFNLIIKYIGGSHEY